MATLKKCLLILFIYCISCNSKSPALFTLLGPDLTGVIFNNTIVENDSLNPIDLEILYNGAGIAIGDFNNDSLPDLYFTGNTVSNKLYLNEGGLHFKDVTEISGVTGNHEWSNAPTVVDINNDGWQDIYVCTSIYQDPLRRVNLLYINQGIGKEGIPVFKESAAAYGLADTSYSVQASFADFDNDGDLDMYLVTTNLAKREAANLNTRRNNNKIDVDKLFRNDYSDSLKHPVFTDISASAGIVENGYGLSVSVADLDKDGWKDIYVTNDFYGSDALYMNNRNGTFTNKIKSCFKHSSQNAMGSDIADLNNDGLPDIFTVDMNPEDNFRKKTNMNSANYYIYQRMMSENIMLQYVRNTLQINQGPRMNNGDSTGDILFSDIGFYAGISQTDWSWSPAIADYDNDGYRDILITNGYPRDVTDHDFSAFRNRNGYIASKKQLIEEIPQIKISNYAFRNIGHLKFQNVTQEWGMNIPSFSTGTVFADLDNDGDLDYIVNNINENAFVYENKLNTIEKRQSEFLDLCFKGDAKNRNGVGVYVEIYYGGRQLQVMENSGTHGYLSCTDFKMHFGLGNNKILDSVVIRWPWINKKQVIPQVRSGQLMIVDINNAKQEDSWNVPLVNKSGFFSEVTKQADIKYIHAEADVIDFNRERLLPHKLSQYGPGLCVGDINNDGLDDIFIGGNSISQAQFLVQEKSNKFGVKALPNSQKAITENMGSLLFDADNDGDLDLYCANGSNEFAAGSESYQDLFFLNDGKGNFAPAQFAIPGNFTSKSCVKAADYDNDGDLDLFIGGRVKPGGYPEPVSSFIYRNDTKNNCVQFTDVTQTVAKELIGAGMVCDAIWTDFNNDNSMDLVVVGEWMPVRFFKNKGDGTFQEVTNSSNIQKNTGWWNSITAGDFDNDGDMDYVVGNTGENSFFQPSGKYPVRMYAKDFDRNGSLDIITSVFLKDVAGKQKEFTFANRDEIMDQVPSLKKNFLTYKSFAQAGIDQVFPAKERSSALQLEATNFKSVLLQNNGNGQFNLIPLPGEAQYAPVYGMVTDDFNEDGMMDILLCGNDFGNEVTNGRYDAMNGLMLLGSGSGKFTPLTAMESGLSITGDAKALVKLRGGPQRYYIAASQNRGPLKLYSAKNKPLYESFEPNEKYAIIYFADGRKRKMERYWGSSFLSQSPDFFITSKTMSRIEFFAANGLSRTIFSH